MQKKSFVRGWIIVVLAFLAWAMMFFFNISLSVYAGPVAILYGATPNQLLYWNTVAGVVGAVIMFLSAKFQDKLNCRWTMAGSALVIAIAYSLIPNIGSITGAGIMLVLSYLGTTFLALLSSFNLIINWFPRKKGSILGIITAGTMLGGLLFNVLKSLITNLTVQVAMPVCGAAALVYAIICVLVIRHTPQECGLLPDNKPMSDEEAQKIYGVKNLSAARENPWTMGKILKNVPFWMTAVAFGLIVLPATGISNFAVAGVQEAGASAESAVFISSLYAVAMFVGSVISGFVDEKLGVKKATLIFSVIMVVSLAGLALAINSASVALFVVMYYLCGAATGTTNNFVGSMTMDQTGPLYFAKIYAVVSCISSLIKCLGNTIAAVSYEVTGAYSGTFVIYAVIAAVGVVVLALNRVVRQEPK